MLDWPILSAGLGRTKSTRIVYRWRKLRVNVTSPRLYAQHHQSGLVVDARFDMKAIDRLFQRAKTRWNILWEALPARRPGWFKKPSGGYRQGWTRLSRRRRWAIVSGGALLVIFGVLGGFVWSGVSAALDARQTYRELQAELSHLTPVDLIQVEVYQSLEGRFRDAEESTRKARSRIGFLRAFTWLPVVGSRIDEADTLLEMGYYQARAGRNLASAYSAAIAMPLDELPPEVAADTVASALKEAEPQLIQAQRDLRRVRALRQQLPATERGTSYGLLVDRYVPALQTVVYLSRTSPDIIGHTYTLSRELTSLQKLAEDPLGVFANPEEAGLALENVAQQAAALEESLDRVRRLARALDSEDPAETEAVIEVLDTLGPGVTMLRHVSAGTRGLVEIAEAMETEGFLSQEFGAVAKVALEQSEQELTLAREQVSSLQKLLSVQGFEAESFIPSILFTGPTDISLTSTGRIEIILDEAISATRFLISFLGFEEPRNYLLLGQNQQEIRASGGFIGIAVQVTIDEGELSDLVFHDSTTVDRAPLTGNPDPPEGLFWYLWMGRLLFRDANWNPHFPSSAAMVAEIYELGQGVQVDGVITGSKGLMLDLIDDFGDIKVPGVSEVLTHQTAEDYTDGLLGYECEARHVSLRGKRCFDEDAFFALQERVTDSPLPDTLRRKLIERLKEHLDKKNILIHVFPPVDDSFLWERGWNGALPSVDHDYLMVVDSSFPGHSTKGVQL